MIVQYWGVQNYMEQPLTGVLRLWTTGQKQDVPSATATQLIGANVGFQFYSDNPDDAPSTTATASRTLSPSDIESVIIVSGSSAVVLTIPLDSVMGATTPCAIASFQSGSGAVSYAAASGVTLNGTAKTAAQYVTQGIMRTGANTWAYIA